VNQPDREALIEGDGAARGPRRFVASRALRRTVGILLALAVAWFIMRAYRSPEFIIDFANMSLC
jgi:hypothetical protein